MPRPKKTAAAPKGAASYSHPAADLAARPEIGTQAHFKKALAPATYRFDSSLAPELNWDGQNPAREEAEALLRAIEEAGSLDEARAAASKLKALSRPFLKDFTPRTRGVSPSPGLARRMPLRSRRFAARGGNRNSSST